MPRSWCRARQRRFAPRAARRGSRWRWGSAAPRRWSCEPCLLQLLAQFFEAAPADEADRSLRNPQLARELFIGPRRLLVEQHAYQPLAARRKCDEGIAQ